MTGQEIERVRGRRASLYRTTLELEHALSSPAADFGPWSDRVLEAASSVVDCIAAHAAESEAPGEFLSNIATDSPHLAHAAKHLQDEHPVLIERSHAYVQLIMSFKDGAFKDGAFKDGAPPDAAEVVRERGLEVLALIVRHRQRGADLMFLAHNEDLGSAG